MERTIHKGPDFFASSSKEKERKNTSLVRVSSQIKTDPSHEKWKLENNLAMTWLLNSMTNDFGEIFMYYDTAAEIWKAANETCSNVGNTLTIFDIKNIEWKYIDDDKIYRKLVEKDIIIQLLLGLNKNLDELRGRILGTKPLPSIREAFAEETCWVLHGKPIDLKPRFKDACGYVVAADERCLAKFLPHFCELQDMNSGKMIGNAEESVGLYFLRIEDQNKRSYQATLMVFEVAKHTKSHYSIQPYKSSRPFTLIHSDMWGPSRVSNVTGSRWFVTFIDDHTRVTWVFLMKEKSEVGIIFENIHKIVETQFQSNIQILRTDNRREYFHYTLESIPIIVEPELDHETTTLEVTKPTNEAPTIGQKGQPNRGKKLQVYIRKKNKQKNHVEVQACTLSKQNQDLEPTHKVILVLEWKVVVMEEIKTLYKKGTWQLSHLPEGKKAVGCKWIFSVKYNADGSAWNLQSKCNSTNSKGGQCAPSAAVALRAHNFLCLKLPTFFSSFESEWGSDMAEILHIGYVEFLVKYNVDGSVNWYKARLVEKGFTLSYRVDYEETFATVAKLNSARAPRNEIHFKDTSRKIEIFTDAEWENSVTNRRSTSGYFSYVWGNLVTWRGKKQSVVARCSAKVELTMSHGICKRMWLHRMLAELPVYSDHESLNRIEQEFVTHNLENLVTVVIQGDDFVFTTRKTGCSIGQKPMLIGQKPTLT
ncbi:uncharacterized protein [Cicer arietinum]|uniref:uncharacterized protein n=1 Tax=Cicer arietinum TaxID=3827 RepID=UPI003CC5A8D9